MSPTRGSELLKQVTCVYLDRCVCFASIHSVAHLPLGGPICPHAKPPARPNQSGSRRRPCCMRISCCETTGYPNALFGSVVMCKSEQFRLPNRSRLYRRLKECDTFIEQIRGPCTRQLGLRRRQRNDPCLAGARLQRKLTGSD